MTNIIHFVFVAMSIILQHATTKTAAIVWHTAKTNVTSYKVPATITENSIEYKVTAINSCAFLDWTNLSTLDLSEATNLKEFGDYIVNNTKVTNLVLSEGVEEPVCPLIRILRPLLRMKQAQVRVPGNVIII